MEENRQRGGPCLNRFLRNAFHFRDLERFGNRHATLGTESVVLQADGNRRNGALGEREGRSHESEYVPEVGPCVSEGVREGVHVKIKTHSMLFTEQLGSFKASAIASAPSFPMFGSP